MSLELFKKIFNKEKKKMMDISEKSPLKPRGIVTIWENEKTDDNILVHDNNLVVKSFFDIMIGIFSGDTNKLITQLALGSGGIVNGLLQTPNVNDLTLYDQFYVKTSYDSITSESILSNYISFNFKVAKTEGNGTGATIVNEIGLLSTDGTMFARKTFQEIIKTPEKELFVEWKLVW